MRPFKEWQVIDTATGQPVSLDQWAALLLQQDIIYLGEEHHNRFHIDAALTVLRRLKAEGVRRPWPWKCSAGTARRHWINMFPGSEMNRQEFLEAVRWQQNWGGSLRGL